MVLGFYMVSGYLGMVLDGQVGPMNGPNPHIWSRKGAVALSSLLISLFRA